MEKETVYVVVDDLGKNSQGVDVALFRTKEEAERHFVRIVDDVMTNEGWINEGETPENFDEVVDMVSSALEAGLRGEIGILEREL